MVNKSDTPLGLGETLKKTRESEKEREKTGQEEDEERMAR